MARPGQGSAQAGMSLWYHGGDAALAETRDGCRGMSTGPQGSRERKKKGGGEKGKSGKQGKQRTVGTKQVPRITPVFGHKLA